MQQFRVVGEIFEALDENIKGTCYKKLSELFLYQYYISNPNSDILSTQTDLKITFSYLVINIM